MATASKQLAGIAARLKVAGDGTLRVTMLRGLKSVAKPVTADLRAAAMAKLPSSGGLNAQVAGQKITVSVRTSVKTAGVRLTTTAPDTAMTDAGFVRHPTFGRRGKGQWRTQQIPQAAGWWSKTLAAKGPQVTAELLAVLAAVEAEIQGL